jgi:membrane protease YdiL (CAAX protease family)
MIPTIDRKRIYIFVGIAYALSIAVALVFLLTGGYFLQYPDVLNPLATGLIWFSMAVPTIAHLVTRRITREGWANTLLSPNPRHGWPFYLAALFLPALANLAGGAVYYLLFPGQFDPSMTHAREELGMIAVGGATGLGIFIIVQTAYRIAGSLAYLPMNLGEEFGWRAYLQQKLLPLGPRKAVLLVGAIWAVWHWPIIFLGYNYGFGYWGAPVAGPLLWVWCLLPASIFYGWLTLRSGSVWPAAIAHGVSNATSTLMVWFIRGPLNPLLDPLIGPSNAGIIGSLGWVVLALALFFIPGALAPSTGPQPGHGTSTGYTLERPQGEELYPAPNG